MKRILSIFIVLFLAVACSVAGGVLLSGYNNALQLSYEDVLDDNQQDNQQKEDANMDGDEDFTDKEVESHSYNWRVYIQNAYIYGSGTGTLVRQSTAYTFNLYAFQYYSSNSEYTNLGANTCYVASGGSHISTTAGVYHGTSYSTRPCHLATSCYYWYLTGEASSKTRRIMMRVHTKNTNCFGVIGGTTGNTWDAGTQNAIRNCTTRVGSTTYYVSSNSPSTSYSIDWNYKVDAAIYVVYRQPQTVTFNSNGGTGAPSSQTFYSGITGTLSSTKPTRPGYTFRGWSTSSTATTASYSAGGSYSLPNSSTSITLYAVWAPTTYNITFNPNGGTANSSTGTTYRSYNAKASSYISGASYTVITSLPSATRTGYTFNGWKPSGTVGSWSSSSTYSSGTSLSGKYGSVTLVAQWSATSYTISYNANGGSVSSSSATYYITTSLTLLTPTRTGYTFNGWKPSSSSGSWSSGTTYSVSRGTGNYGNVTLVAQWTIKSFYVTVIKGNYGVSDITKPATSWNYNDGRDGKRVLVNYGASQTISVSIDAGYSFSHWEGDSSSTSSSITFTVNQEKDYTFVAYAKANTYTLTYNANGGTASTSSKTVTYNSTYGTLATATRSNYTFAGWWTAPSGGTRVYDTTTYSTVGDTTLYAHWTPVPITNKVYLRMISKNGNSVSVSNAGGSVSVLRYLISGSSSSASATNQTAESASYTVHQGQQFKITANANSGYVFAGFSTSPTPSASIKNPSAPVNTTATYYPTSGTDYYVYFKQLSGNQLKYDEVDKYFYFEDGYYPQSEANSLKNISAKTGEVNGLNVGYDAKSNVVTLNGYYQSEVTGVGELLKTENIKNIKKGKSVFINIEYLGGQVLGGGRVTIIFYAYNSEGKEIGCSRTGPNVDESSIILYGDINEDANEGYFKIYIWRNYDSGGAPQFVNARFRLTISYVAIDETSTTETGETFVYNNGTTNVEIPVYSYGSDRFVKVTKNGTSAWFKFEPIRWRISDYGVEKTERNIERYKTLLNFRNYTSYATNFTAVSDLILGVGAMHNTRSTVEGTSVTSMAGYQNVRDTLESCSISFGYAKSDNIIKVDSFSTYSQNNTVYTTDVAYTSPLRIASLSEIENVGFANKQARASDMVAFILGVDKNNVSYWTRDLSNLGAGVAITASGVQIRPWLDQMLGMRFAYTFTEGSNIAFYS